MAVSENSVVHVLLTTGFCLIQLHLTCCGIPGRPGGVVLATAVVQVEEGARVSCLMLRELGSVASGRKRLALPRWDMNWTARRNPTDRQTGRAQICTNGQHQFRHLTAIAEGENPKGIFI